MPNDVRRFVPILFGLLILFSTPIDASAAGPSKLWASEAGSNEVVVSPDGATVFTDGVFALDAATGAPDWHEDAAAAMSAVALSPDGSVVYGAGEIVADVQTYDRDFFTAAIDAASGSILWSKTYDGPADPGTWGLYDYDQIYGIAASPDGGTVFVTGHSDSKTTPNDFVTIAYQASSGHLLWKDRYAGNFAGDAISQVVVTPDSSGAVILVQSSDPDTGSDFLTISYDASTGQRLWKRRFDGPVSAYDIPRAIGLSPTGNRVFVAGTVQADTQTGYTDVAVISYRTSNGAVVWSKQLGGASSWDAARALDVSPDGAALFITGTHAADDVSSEVSTISLDATTGATNWSKRYAGPGGSFNDGYDVVVAPDGSAVYAVGQVCATSAAGSCTDSDYGTIAYDASSGSRLWVKRYAPGNWANAVAVSPDGGSLFVGGIAGGCCGKVVAYSI